MPSRTPWPAVVVTLAACAILVWGWHSVWFLCDDAFITFRYASNSLAGRGYVWNPAPLHPVEGYSSFAWLVLLDLTWRLTGLEPPRAANLLSLACSLVTLVGLAWFAWTQRALRGLDTEARVVWLGIVLLGVVSNRTWLTWTSSGLETALWTLVLLAWVAVGLRSETRDTDLAWMAVASILPVVRPDGLLFAAATAILVGHRHRDPRLLAPLMVPLLHVLWRRATYGAWLPNTFAAKVSDPWLDMGVRYGASFALEYGFVWWCPVVLMGIVAHRPSRAELAVFGLLAAHTAYYLAAVGGDHFEYRILVHWVPLLWVALPVWVVRLQWRPQVGQALAVGLLLVGLVLPWTHWHKARPLVQGMDKATQFVPIAPEFPRVLQPLVARYDLLQRTMIKAYVCLRWHSHSNYLREQRRHFGERQRGQTTGPEGAPALARNGIGYPGWALPDVIIVDRHGLNDRVVSHNPPKPERKRRMAHERGPPDGYVDACYDPNVGVRMGGHVRVKNRPRLGIEEMAACEERFYQALVTTGRPPEGPR